MTRVAEAYRGQEVFLTGVTGFLGQIVLCQLLRVAPDVKCITLLIRPSGGSSALERFDLLLRTSPVLRILQEHVDMSDDELLKWVHSKVAIAEGDLGGTGTFGLAKEQLEELHQSINIVIHSAADVAFTRPFPQAMRSNFLSTVAVQAFARRCSHIKLMCYVSTAYVSSNARDVAKHCTSVTLPFDVAGLLHAVQTNNTTRLEHYERAMRSCGWPNTYVMSKVAAENHLLRFQQGLPTLIVRPSMIGCSYKLLKGWNLSMGGPTLSTYGIGLGAARILPTISHTLDIVPVDYCANIVIISVAHFTQLPPAQKKQIHIHHAVMGLHRIPQRLFYDTVLEHYRAEPLPDQVAAPQLTIYNSPSRFRRALHMRYTIPRHIFGKLKDSWPSKPPKPLRDLAALSRQMDQLYTVSNWVLTRDFMFVEGGERAAFESLVDEREKEILWHDLGEIDLQDYVHTFCRGINELMATQTSESPQSHL